MFKKKKQQQPKTEQEEISPVTPDSTGAAASVDGQQQVEGFICPVCMASLASPEELQEHFEKDHSLPTESETSLQNPQVAEPTAEVKPYVPLPPPQGEDESDFYKNQLDKLSQLITDERLQNATLRKELQRAERTSPNSNNAMAVQELRSLRDMFEQSERSRIAMKQELVRVNTDLQQAHLDRREVEEMQQVMARKAASMSVEVVDLRSKLDESQGKIQNLQDQLISLQLNTKEQEIRNERLAIKLQQRPEADDVKALKQELTTLHVLLEDTNTDTKRTVQALRDEKEKIEVELERARKGVHEMELKMSQLPSETDLLKKDAEMIKLKSLLEERTVEVKRLEISLESSQNVASGRVDAAVVIELKDTNSRLKGDLEEIRNTLKQRDGQLASLQADLLAAPKQEQLNQLLSESKELKEELQRKHEQNRELEGLKMKLESKLERAPKSEDIERRDARIKSLELELAAAPKQSRTDQLESEVKRLQEELMSAPKSHQYDSLQEELRDKENSISQLQGALNEKDGRLQLLEGEVVKYKEELKMHSASLSTVRGSLLEKESSAHSLEVTLASAQEENKHLIRQVQHLEKQLETKEGRYDELQQKLDHLKEDILASQKEKADLITKIEAGEGATEAIVQLEQEKTNIQRKMEEATEAASVREKEMEQRFGVMEGRNEELKASLEQLQRECDNLRGDLKENEFLVATTTGKIEVLTAELKEKSEVMQEKEKNFAKSEDSFKTQLESLKLAVSASDSKNKQLQDQLSQMEKQALQKETDLKEQLSSFKTEATKQIQELTAELQMKREELNDSLTKWNEDRVNLANQVASLETKLLGKEEEIKKSVKRIIEVEERESAVQLKSTEEIKQLKEDFNRVKHELEASLNEKSIQVVTAQEKLSHLQEKLANTETLLVASKTECASLQESNSKQKADFELAKGAHDLELTQANQKILQLEQAKSMIQNEIVSLEKKMDSKMETHKLELSSFEVSIATKEKHHKEAVVKYEEDMRALHKEIAKKEKEINEMKEALRSKEAKLEESQQKIVEKIQEEGQIKQEVSKLRAQCDSTTEAYTAQQAKGAELQSQLRELEKDLQTKIVELGKVSEILQNEKSNRMADREQFQLERENMDKDRTTLEDMIEKMTREKVELQVSVRKSSEECSQVKSELQEMETKLSTQTDYHQEELQTLAGTVKEQERTIAGLTESLGQLRTQFEIANTRKEEFEESSLHLTGLVEELKVKNKSLQDENRAVLEKCLKEEERGSQLGELNRELEAKMQEISTTNNQLKREISKYKKMKDQESQRRWEEDDEVTHCPKCTKKFGAMLRKHHCRNCGRIFCQQCASKQCMLPSSKKPVRVCDNCYSHLNKQS